MFQTEDAGFNIIKQYCDCKIHQYLPHKTMHLPMVDHLQLRSIPELISVIVKVSFPIETTAKN